MPVLRFSPCLSQHTGDMTMPFFRFTTVLAAALAGGLFLAAAQVRAQAPAPLSAPAPVPVPAPAKPYRIGAAVYGLKGEFMQMWTKELKAHPAVKDGTVQITVFDGNYDALTQSNQFDTMITQKYDGILFMPIRSEEHTSELQSQSNLVCRLLLEKKKTIK